MTRARRALWLALFVALPALAVDMTPPLPDAGLQQRYYELTHELRCMQCQNESLADSTVGLAGDLRLQVRELLMAGRTDDEIRDYMVARYGEFILFRPRMNLRNAWLWSAPVVLLVAGIWVAARVLRRRASLVGNDQTDIE
jgi:cytochrome c-type biogenesis protein CcmH